MTRVGEWLVRAYPADVRYAYGQEILEAFAQELAERRHHHPTLTGWFSFQKLSLLLLDVALERANTLYSHRSFHGRGRPDVGVVRPPNMSKKEWFDLALSETPDDAIVQCDRAAQ